METITIKPVNAESYRHTGKSDMRLILDGEFLHYKYKYNLKYHSDYDEPDVNCDMLGSVIKDEVADLNIAFDRNELLYHLTILTKSGTTLVSSYSANDHAEAKKVYEKIFSWIWGTNLPENLF